MTNKNSSVKQVVILAGGKGTRMREMTETLPKPMVTIGGIPVIEHLMNIFNFYGTFEYIICGGYKNENILQHFDGIDNVKVINTGENTNTGERVLKVESYLDENFIVTYGDGLANVNIRKLINFHKSHNNIGTISVANPTSRFGLLEFDENKCVTSFIEKPKLNVNVNIGFMVFKKYFLNYLNEGSVLETQPLMNLSSEGKLFAFEHPGYFEPMDTYREYLRLNEYWESGQAPWTKLEE